MAHDGSLLRHVKLPPRGMFTCGFVQMMCLYVIDTLVGCTMAEHFPSLSNRRVTLLIRLWLKLAVLCHFELFNMLAFVCSPVRCLTMREVTTLLPAVAVFLASACATPTPTKAVVANAADPSPAPSSSASSQKNQTKGGTSTVDSPVGSSTAPISSSTAKIPAPKEPEGRKDHRQWDPAQTHRMPLSNAPKQSLYVRLEPDQTIGTFEGSMTQYVIVIDGPNQTSNKYSINTVSNSHCDSTSWEQQGKPAAPNTTPLSAMYCKVVVGFADTIITVVKRGDSLVPILGERRNIPGQPAQISWREDRPITLPPNAIIQ